MKFPDWSKTPFDKLRVNGIQPFVLSLSKDIIQQTNQKNNLMNPVIDHLDIWSSVYVKKSTTGRGRNSKISPYGIQKLRELILELAVRGKLVPQDPNDEPASVLLVKIAKEKARLIKEKEIRKTKKPAPYGEPPEHDLPHSWSWTTLYELGEIGPRNDLVDQLETAFVPMQCISEKYGALVQYELRQWKEIKTGFTHFQENDVVLAKITPCFQNGKSAVMHGLKNGVGAGTTELHVFRSINDTVIPEYVLIYLKSPSFILEGIHRMTGTAGQKRITRDYFSGKPFPLPPPAEQHRIVAKVDELMALCDQLEQQQTNSITAHQTLVETLLNGLLHPVRPEPALRQAQDNRGTAVRGEPVEPQAWTRIDEHFDTLFTTEHSIDQLKQTILQLAVMGKLVPQDPNDEPASVLLEKITEEKVQLIQEGKLKKQKASPGISEAEKPFDLPAGWEWARLPDIGELARGKSKHRPRNDPKLHIGGATPMVQTGDVSKADTKIITYTALYNETGVAQSRLWPKGTMCITIAANIADTGILGFEACFPDSVVGFIPLDSRMNVRYFEYFIRTAKNHLEDFAPSTAQKNINLEILGKLLVPLPPVNELNRIIAKVDELIALCDALKARLQDAQTTQVQLADAIVEQAVT